MPNPAPTPGDPAEPLPGVFLTAEWRWLVMLNYEVDPAALRPLVPRGTELDTWDGATLVSMVGFMFLRTRVLGVRIPFHSDFEEVNLRFYVRRRGPEGWRRAVVFVKEIVPRAAIAVTARALYGEKYVAMPMHHRVGLPGAGGSREDGVVEYRWRHRGRWSALKARAVGEPKALVAGSEEEFVTEHYWGYAARRGGGTTEYRVEHPAWRVWSATDAALHCDAARLYGPAFAAPLAAPPRSAFIAEGSPITVRRGVRVA